MSVAVPPAGDIQAKTRELRLWLGIVIVMAVLLRLGLWFTYQPVAYGDTPSYRRLAEAVKGGFEHYDGTRTPGYPAFLALVGSDRQVWLAQMIIGLGITLLFFYMGYQLSGKPWFGGLAALAHTLNLGQVFFEANLLSETLTTFFMAISIAGLLYWLKHSDQRGLWLAGGLGLSSALALLTRPLFIFFPFWTFIFLIFVGSPRNWLKGKFLAAVIYLIPVVMLVGGWIGFIRSHFGDWGLTTMTGYHLIQHTGNYFEYVPDKYAGIRDVYLQYRAAHIAQYDTQTNTIWEAIPAMQEISGLSFYDLSRLLVRISLELIREHPTLYLQRASEGWLLFWRAPVYWSPEALLPSLHGSFLALLITLERLLLVGANLLFVVMSFSMPVYHRQLIKDNPHRVFSIYLLGTILIASIIQTLLDHGDNPRFLVPLQSFVVLWLLWMGMQIAIWLKSRKVHKTI